MTHVQIIVTGERPREGNATVLSFDTEMPLRDLMQALRVMTTLLRNAGNAPPLTLEG